MLGLPTGYGPLPLFLSFFQCWQHTCEQGAKDTASGEKAAAGQPNIAHQHQASHIHGVQRLTACMKLHVPPPPQYPPTTSCWPGFAAAAAACALCLATSRWARACAAASESSEGPIRVCTAVKSSLDSCRHAVSQRSIRVGRMRHDRQPRDIEQLQSTPLSNAAPS